MQNVWDNKKSATNKHRENLIIFDMKQLTWPWVIGSDSHRRVFIAHMAFSVSNPTRHVAPFTNMV